MKDKSVHRCARPLGVQVEPFFAVCDKSRPGDTLEFPRGVLLLNNPRRIIARELITANERMEEEMRRW